MRVSISAVSLKEKSSLDELFGMIIAMGEKNALKAEHQTKFEVNFFARVSLFVTLFVLIIFGIIEFFTNDIFILTSAAMMGGAMESMAFVFSCLGLKHGARANQSKDLAVTALIAAVMGAVIIFGFILGDIGDGFMQID